MQFDLKYREFAARITDDLFLHPYGDHGIQHSKRVLYLACQLAKKYQLTEKEWHCLAIACCYHDIGRVHDLEDNRHGQDSVHKMIKLNIHNQEQFSDEEFEIVQQLMIYHAMDDSLYPNNIGTRAELMWKIMKDADALDRVRFDDLDPQYLRLKESAGLIPLAVKLCYHDSKREI